MNDAKEEIRARLPVEDVISQYGAKAGGADAEREVAVGGGQNAVVYGESRERDLA